MLHGVSISPTSVTPGQRVTVAVDASDDVAVKSVGVAVFERTSGTYTYVTDSSAPFDVPLDVVSGWANGTWRILAVDLTDAAGNFSLYNRSGSYSQRPSSSTTTHSVELQSQEFTVTGASDLSPPVLDAFSMTTRATRADQASTYAWTVHDSGDVASIRVVWSGIDAQTTHDTVLATSPADSGTAAMALPLAGRWQLTHVLLTDGAGNTSSYQVDGSLSVTGPYGPRTHDIDLASLAHSLAPAAPRTNVLDRPGRLTVRLPAGEALQRVVSGYRVTAQPSGVVKEVAVAPTLPDSWMAVDLTGLPNGTTQTISVTAHSTWGDSPVTTTSGRPVLSSNVAGVPDPLGGDGVPDVVAQRQFGTTADGRVMLYRGSGSGGLKPAQTYRTGNWDHCQALGAFSYRYFAEGLPLCRTDRLEAMDRTTNVGLGSRGWSTMRWVDGGFSLDADRTGDVIAVDPSGILRRYPQTSNGKLLTSVSMGTGWGSMISVISAGDLTGDRKNDIVAVDAAGRLWLYPGNGRGGLTTRRQIGSGWHQMGALVALRDVDRDGRADLGGITMGGELRLYRGTGAGGVKAPVVLGRGWQMYL